VFTALYFAIHFSFRGPAFSPVYDRDMPLGGLLADALVLPLFDGGNMGVRRRQLHELLKSPYYDPLAALAPPAGQ
jgi:hypothetical protein